MTMSRSAIMLVAAITVASVPATASIGVNTGAKIRGTYGLEVGYAGTSTTDRFVRDNSPANEDVYSAQFFLRNQVTAIGDGHQIFRTQGPSGPVFQVILRSISNGDLFIYVYAFQDDGSRSRVLITHVPTTHHLKFDLAGSTAPGANNGFLRIYKAKADGSWACLKQVTNLDNDVRANITAALLGSFTGLDAETEGNIDLDEFASFRTVESAPSCPITFVQN